MPSCEIAATDQSPRMLIHVNPSYALYHWLRTEAARPGSAHSDAQLRDAVQLARGVVNPRGVHGVWDVWEGALASAEDEEPFEKMRETLVRSADDLTSALHNASAYFLWEIWPTRQDAIQRAIETIEARRRTTLLAAYPAFRRR